MMIYSGVSKHNEVCLSIRIVLSRGKRRGLFCRTMVSWDLAQETSLGLKAVQLLKTGIFFFH